MGRQPGRFVVALGVMCEVEVLAVECGQPRFDVTPTALVFGQRQHTGEIGLGEPLDLLAQRGPAAAQVGLTRLQLLRQPLPAARSRHRVRNHLR